MWEAPWQESAGPESDVFSLGCVFTELLVHMRGRSQSVSAFRERRKPDKDLSNAPFCIEGRLSEVVQFELESICKDTVCVQSRGHSSSAGARPRGTLNGRPSGRKAGKYLKERYFERS